MSRDNNEAALDPPPQALAGAALSYLKDSEFQLRPLQSREETYLGHNFGLSAIKPHLGASAVSVAQSIALTPAGLGNGAVSGVVDTLARKAQFCRKVNVDIHAPEGSPAATIRSLPSLLRYVDHDLMQNAAIHNHPPIPSMACPVCLLPWDSAIPLPSSPSSLPSLNTPHTHTITSAFLPLSPCGHWIHYHCFIRLTTHPESYVRDKCFVCRMSLFEWEGITALTLATRTNLSLEDCNKNGSWHLEKRVWIPSDTSAYESDCALIVSLISHAFFAQLQQPSKYVDGSPDLVIAYYQVMNELERMKRPTARWLAWTTQTGSLLLGMLVALKMRRFLVEGHVNIVKTQAWIDFEKGGRTLQGRILEEVNKK